MAKKIISNFNKKTRLHFLPGAPLISRGGVFGPISDELFAKITMEEDFHHYKAAGLISVVSSDDPVLVMKITKPLPVNAVDVTLNATTPVELEQAEHSASLSDWDAVESEPEVKVEPAKKKTRRGRRKKAQSEDE